MTLKTATRISLVGTTLYTILSILWFFYEFIMSNMHQPTPLWAHQAFWFLAIVLFNGSIVLFLAVLYSKQKGVKD